MSLLRHSGHAHVTHAYASLREPAHVRRSSIIKAEFQSHAPHRRFYLDMFCYACLIMQFCLEVFVRSSQSLGVAIHSSNIYFRVMVAAADASAIIRWGSDSRVRLAFSFLLLILAAGTCPLGCGPSSSCTKKDLSCCRGCASELRLLWRFVLSRSNCRHACRLDPPLALNCMRWMIRADP